MSRSPERDYSLSSGFPELSAYGGNRPSLTWSPDNIKFCEVCSREFTFTRRKHHCRKCGCIVCGRCSDQTLVLPSLGINPKRVCDGCYERATLNPVLLFQVDNVEDELKQKLMKETVHIAIITKNSVEVQAIVQGSSMALSGSPLGTQIDVHSYSAPMTEFQIDHRNDAKSEVIDINALDFETSSDCKDPSSGEPDTLPPPPSVVQQEVSSIGADASESIFDLSLLCNEAKVHRAAVTKAREARRKFVFENNREPDFSVGIEPGVVLVAPLCLQQNAKEADDGLAERSSDMAGGAEAGAGGDVQCLVYSWVVVIGPVRPQGITPPSTAPHMHMQTSSCGPDGDELQDGAVVSGCAKTSAFPLPPAISSRVMAGLMTLEEAQGGGMDAGDFLNLIYSRGEAAKFGKGGAVAHLTHGKITRALHLQSAVHLAFIPFLWSELYETTVV